MATFLTGRHLDCTLFPFSFREYLKYHQVEVKETTRGISLVKSKLQEYLNQGEFPESYKLPSSQYLRTLFSDIITRDVMLRCRTSRTIVSLADFLLSDIGKEVTTRRLGNIFNISHQTVENYLGCLQDAYLFFLVKRFTGKLTERYTLPRKVYVIDTGLYSSLKKFEIGKLMENTVFIELMRKAVNSGKEIFYYSSSTAEVDFIYENKAIQVTYDSQGIDEREYKGLKEFSDKYSSYELQIITWDSEGKESLSNGKEVKLIPLWKFLLVEA